MTFVINKKTAMNILDISKKQDMRIHILKNYVKDLQCLLDENKIDYSELRKKYLFQYSFTNNEIATEEQKKTIKRDPEEINYAKLMEGKEHIYLGRGKEIEEQKKNLAYLRRVSRSNTL